MRENCFSDIVLQMTKLRTLFKNGAQYFSFSNRVLMKYLVVVRFRFNNCIYAVSYTHLVQRLDGQFGQTLCVCVGLAGQKGVFILVIIIVIAFVFMYNFL